jgi:hypothetical protein
MFLDDVDYLVWDLYYTLPIKSNHAHLPCMQAYSLRSFHPMYHLHKHLRACIIQDRKPRAQSSYPRSPRSSSRCSLKRWPKQTRRTLKNFRSAPITARAPSREASPGAFFSPGLQLLINALLDLTWCITFRSCQQTLLHYSLFTFVILYPCYLGIRSRVNA